MKTITRRGLFAGAAVTAGLLGLTGCENQSEEQTASNAGSGYTETETDQGYVLVDNGDGKQLGYWKESGLKLIEQDGYAFKDFEGTGELVPYEDWRLSAEERAEDLASRISLEQIVGLMCFSLHQVSIEDDCSVTDEQKEFLDGGVRAVLNAAYGFPAFQQARWANNMQGYVEGSGNKIPINFSTDPRPGKNCTNWPNNIATAASFDPEVAKEVAVGQASDLRKMGISTFLGPQVDVATEPRWFRFRSTFGEDPALSRDLCKAFCDGIQSTIVDGEDQGWGTGSMVAMVKHWCSEASGEGGREAHVEQGKYSVYPGDNFDALLIPFVDGAFKLDGKTKTVASIMTSYSISYDDDEKYGELVGSGFSKYKVQELLRDKYGFQGAACTDWGVLEDVDAPDANAWNCWGLEDPNEWDPAKRASRSIEVGVDQMGGWNDPSTLMTAYEDMKADLGEDQANANFRTSAKRLLLGYFNTGLFENPYVDVEAARDDIDKAPEDTVAAALTAQVKGIVMLKNHDGAIKAAQDDSKPKVYVPMRYTAAAKSCSGNGAVKWSEDPATCELPLAQATLEKYFDVVTDTLAETLTGPADEDGNATPAEADLTRLTAADIADCDCVVVIASEPINANTRRGQDEDGNFIPLSVQYRPYTADNEYVRQVSLAGNTLEDGTKENRSYYGRTSMVTNEAQLDQILEAAAVAHEAGKPCIVVLDLEKPMCVHEFEPDVDAILLSMSGCVEAACCIIAGQDEPSALLPMQMPKDMIDVEQQLEDVPRDMECYTDADGNTYDFGFGLNYSGPISDERTEKYCVEPLTVPEN